MAVSRILLDKIEPILLSLLSCIYQDWMTELTCLVVQKSH